MLRTLQLERVAGPIRFAMLCVLLLSAILGAASAASQPDDAKKGTFAKVTGQDDRTNESSNDDAGNTGLNSLVEAEHEHPMLHPEDEIRIDMPVLPVASDVVHSAAAFYTHCPAPGTPPPDRA